MIHLLGVGKHGSIKESAEQQAGEWASWFGSRGKQAYKHVEHVVIEHPAAALVAALGIGVVAGWIIKRLR